MKRSEMIENLAKKRIIIHLLVTFPTLVFFLDKSYYDNPSRLLGVVLGLIVFSHVGARIWDYLESGKGRV